MKIGIFGGSFNPVHIGHAIIASHIQQHSELDQVWFMVAPQNPLKKSHNDSNMDIHRLRMTELVTRRIPNASTSAFEFNLPQPSFTINTLGALKEKFPEHSFSLIIGADNWELFPRWKDAEKIIANHDIYIYPRLGFSTDVPEHLKRVHVVDAPVIEISSTQIRKSIAGNDDIQFLVTDEVNNYIKQNMLYRNDE